MNMIQRRDFLILEEGVGRSLVLNGKGDRALSLIV